MEYFNRIVKKNERSSSMKFDDQIESFFFESFSSVCTLIDFDEKINMMEFRIDLENKVNCLMSLYFIDLEWQFFFLSIAFQ